MVLAPSAVVVSVPLSIFALNDSWIFSFTKGPTKKGIATADLTNGYLHAKCYQEIYLEIPPEYRTPDMAGFDTP